MNDALSDARNWSEAALELVRQHPSIHRDGRAGHVGSVCGGYKDDDMSDLLRCCETLDWHGRDECGLIFIRIGEACEHARIRSARSYYIYAHTGSRDFQCSGLCQSFDRMFTRHVNRCAGSADASIGRRDIDYAPAVLRKHHAQFMLHAQQHAQYIGIERGRVKLCCLLGYESPRPLSCSVVDSNVQPAKTFHVLVHQVTHFFFNAHISTNKLSLGPACPEFRTQSC